MISIERATEKDNAIIARIGRISVGDAHRESCAEEDLDAFLQKNYNAQAIKEELKDPNNVYHIIYYNDVPAGFSKIVLNAKHPNIKAENVTKLDRIYLLKEFQGLQLGHALLNFNIELAKQNGQSGIWLFTWVGNTKAVDFYNKEGFEMIGSHKFYVTETHYNDNHHMMLAFPDAA